jgi:hypothetical protein
MRSKAMENEYEAYEREIWDTANSKQRQRLVNMDMAEYYTVMSTIIELVNEGAEYKKAIIQVIGE